MKLLPFLFSAILSNQSLYAQPSLIKNIEQPKIKTVTFDRAGDLYIVSSAGIIKYDKNGKKLNESILSKTPSSFDTGNGVRMLTYSRSDQQFTILTPTLSEVTVNKIDNSVAITPWLVCSSGDYNILILDAADWSIKKMDTRDSRVIMEFQIDTLLTTDPQFITMREYQNMIFLLDKTSGLSIFNSLGIRIKTLNEPGLNYFNFLGQELYYQKEKAIHFIDLFTMERRQEALMESYDYIALTDERLVGVKGDVVQLFQYNPQ